jgi:hypothetical protein
MTYAKPLSCPSGTLSPFLGRGEIEGSYLEFMYNLSK